MPKYSITIPAFKARYLHEAIFSCLQQTYSDFELIIVDDASPEDLKSVVQQFADPRVNYYRNDVNCGAINVVDNWNKCLEYASGEFIVCMGDDDRLLPDCLKNYDELIGKYPQLDVYHTWTQIIDESSKVFELQESRPEWESALSAQYYRWDHRWKQYIGDFCFRTDILRKAGGFYKLPLAWGSDDITVFRAAMQKGIANTQKFGFQYRKSSMTITNSGNQKLKVEAHLHEWKWFEKELMNYTCCNSNDSLFLELLHSRMDDHYQEKILDMVEEDLNHSVFNLKYWLDNGSKYGLSTHFILSFYIHIVRKYKRIHF